MSATTDNAKALLDIALETYVQELQPGLPKDKRYTGAMIANALGIATRRLSNPEPSDALLKGTGADNLEALANSIRSGAVSDQSHNGLRDRLLEFLEAELAITNPKFLDRRKE